MDAKSISWCVPVLQAMIKSISTVWLVLASSCLVVCAMSSHIGIHSHSSDSGLGIEHVTEAMAKLGLENVGLAMKGKLPAPWCDAKEYGKGWGGHTLCNLTGRLPVNCTFVSFGISNDYSFDTDLAENHGCSGFAFDPSVTYSTQLGKNLIFLQIGANLYPPSHFTHFSGGFALASVPLLMKSLNVRDVNILKMDCEGCEYALAEDVLSSDPHFFHRVDQFALEIHVSKAWVKSKEYGVQLGKLFVLLEKAGLELAHVALTPCHPTDEDMGCDAFLTSAGYPCKRGEMCQNLLFARNVQHKSV